MDLLRLFIISTCFASQYGLSQFSEEQAARSKRFEHVFARSIERVDTLQMDVILTYSHNTEFECIHLTDVTGKIHLVDIRLRGSLPGYIQLYKDELAEVIFEIRYAGSENRPLYFSINKYNGSKKWLKN